MSQHSVARTRMINLPAELGWISKNLPLSPRPSGCALALALCLGPWGGFLMSHPRSAGRFIPDHWILSSETFFNRFFSFTRIFLASEFFLPRIFFNQNFFTPVNIFSPETLFHQYFFYPEIFHHNFFHHWNLNFEINFKK